MKKILSIFIVITVIAALLFNLTSCGDSRNPVNIKEFERSTLAEQGIDPNEITKILDGIHAQNAKVTSLLILRNDYIVFEEYFNNSSADTAVPIFSCTKSFTSTIVGNAIDAGLIKGVDQKVTDFFPNTEIPENLAYKKDMTIEHLLSMTAGYNNDEMVWDYVYDVGDEKAPDALAEYLFLHPTAIKPGAGYSYNEAGPLLLSHIFFKATGKTLYQYGKEKIFDPLGITSIDWGTDASGANTGGSGINITAFDMMRFGRLILNNGELEGNRYVSAEWLSKVRTLNDFEPLDYGYLFWVHDDDILRMDGFMGQRIFTVPGKDLVIVLTTDSDYGFELENFLETISDEPLPEDEQANENLKNAVEALQPKYPSVEELEAKYKIKETHEIDLSTMTENEVYDNSVKIFHKITNTILSIQSDEETRFMETSEEYGGLMRIDLKAKINNSYLRLLMNKGAVVINRGDVGDAIIRIYDPVYGTEIIARNKDGGIPINEFVDVSWIIAKEFQAVIINGEVKFYSEENGYKYEFNAYPAEKAISGKIGVSSAWGNIIDVEKLTVNIIE